VYTLTQDDVDAGSLTNTATVTGEDPDGEDVTDADDDIQNFTEEDSIGVAKRVVGDPEEVSAGTWNVTYEILVGNYTNVSLTRIQVADDLLATFPPETVFTVLEVTSADFVLNPDFDGIPAPEGDINLLAEDVNSLAVGESGTITILVQVIPASGGPFDNTAIASGETPSGEEVQDESQDGDDPDPDDDGDPLNNNEPTPLDFGPNLFDPPYGIKLLNERNLPLLEWTMVWINDTNIVAINVIASDGIPEGTTFYDTGIESGYPLPTGDLPEGTVSTGVQCLDDSDTTTTTHCYYEGPTDEYPLGRIVWQGRLGPDLGVTDPEDALHEIRITFQVMIDRGVTQVTNTATVDVDRDGDGDTDDDGEQEVAIAEEIWNAARELPDTGFAPGVISWIPPQSPLKAYTDLDTIILEVPALKQSMEVVSVPLVDGEWDVTWLGNAAGHLAGSAFPTWQGNTVITAHVYDAFGRPGPFYNLKGLRYGDQVRIHAFGMTYTYEVREILLVDYNNMKAVMKHEELDWITLVTCEHYNALTGEYPFRRVVRAVLIQVVED
jgi:LPXTG-site transpeptidase (sortase) family protein